MAVIRLHVDTLVLHGFDPHGRHALADAVQAELTRLLAASLADRTGAHLLDSDRRHRRVDAGSFVVDADARPATTGSSLAAALHAALEPLLGPETPAGPGQSPGGARDG